MLESRCTLSHAPNFEPMLDGDPARPDAARGATLPCHHGITSRGAVAHTARRRSPHTGRSSSYAAPDENDSAAKRFAERSLRMVLEVLDGRRGVVQLRPLADPVVVSAVQTLARTGVAERRLGAAVLAGVRIVPVERGTAEVFGGYERGGRRFAVAARITARRGEWRVTALRLR
jgi:hypothetical protein